MLTKIANISTKVHVTAITVNNNNKGDFSDRTARSDVTCSYSDSVPTTAGITTTNFSTINNTSVF